MGVKHIVLAICGASGSIYGIRLLKQLVEHDIRVELIVSTAGKKVLSHEAGYQGGDLASFFVSTGIAKNRIDDQVTLIDEQDFFSRPASGSFLHDGMVIAPCSMGTLGAIAAGVSGNMVHRAADVSLKEKRPLILLVRETPLGSVHLKNMLKLDQAGAVIMPAVPSFYTAPKTITDLIDTVTARVLNHLKIAHTIVPQWGD